MKPWAHLPRSSAGGQHEGYGGRGHHDPKHQPYRVPERSSRKDHRHRIFGRPCQRRASDEHREQGRSGKIVASASNCDDSGYETKCSGRCGGQR